MDKKQEVPQAPSNVQLQTQIKDTNSKLDKLIDVISKQTEGVGTRQQVEPKPEAPKPVGGMPQNLRDTVDKVLGKDFGLRLSDDEAMVIITPPDKYSVYHTPEAKAAYEGNFNTKKVDYENFLTRTNPDIPDDTLREKLEEWNKNNKFTMPEDRRPLAFVEAVVPGKWESYCQLVRRNIEKEADVKLEPNA